MATWTQGDVDNLKAAVAGGVLRVKYDGPPSREVQYQDLRAMRDLLASMQADVASATGGRSGYSLAATRKGFGGGADREHGWNRNGDPT